MTASRVRSGEPASGGTRARLQSGYTSSRGDAMGSSAPASEALQRPCGAMAPSRMRSRSGPGLNQHYELPSMLPWLSTTSIVRQHVQVQHMNEPRCRKARTGHSLPDWHTQTPRGRAGNGKPASGGTRAKLRGGPAAARDGGTLARKVPVASPARHRGGTRARS